MDGDKELRTIQKNFEVIENELRNIQCSLIRLSHDMEALENKLKTKFPGF